MTAAAAATETRGARVAAWVALLALLVAVASSPPWVRSDDVPEGFFGRLVEGDLERRDGEQWRTVRAGELVRDGSEVRSGDGARLEVPDGEAQLAAATAAQVDRVTELQTGRMLLDGGDEVEVAVGHVVASGTGVWRVDADQSERVAVYDGRVAVRPGAGGDEVELGRLSEVGLVAGRLPDRAVPLRYARDDAWDARHLRDVISVDDEAGRLARGLAAQYGEAPRSRDFYAAFTVVDGAVVGALDRFGTLDGQDRIGPPSTVLLHVFVTSALIEAGLAPPEAADEVLSARRDGATWGIVLGRRGLGSTELREVVDLSVEAAAENLPPEPAAADAGESPADEDPPAGTSATPPSGDASSTPPPGSSQPTTPRSGSEPTSPVDDTTDDVGDTAGGLLDDVGDAVNDGVGQEPGTGGGVGDTVDEVGDAVGGAANEVGGTVGGLTDHVLPRIG